jgi:hypothetical protein
VLIVVVPEVGMTFASQKDAYDMYNTYIGKIEFNIRKSDTHHHEDKSISSKLIVCNK